MDDEGPTVLLDDRAPGLANERAVARADFAAVAPKIVEAAGVGRRKETAADNRGDARADTDADRNTGRPRPALVARGKVTRRQVSGCLPDIVAVADPAWFAGIAGALIGVARVLISNGIVGSRGVSRVDPAGCTRITITLGLIGPSGTPAITVVRPSRNGGLAALAIVALCIVALCIVARRCAIAALQLVLIVIVTVLCPFGRLRPVGLRRPLGVSWQRRMISRGLVGTNRRALYAWCAALLGILTGIADLTAFGIPRVSTWFALAPLVLLSSARAMCRPIAPFGTLTLALTVPFARIRCLRRNRT